MIPIEAIEKAIEGGWSGVGVIYEVMDWGIVNLGTEQEMSWAEIALDPSFWQSLGKALGWDGEVKIRAHKDKSRKRHWENDYYDDWRVLTRAEYHAHRFYDLILTGGDTKAFWQHLLASK